MVKHPDLDLNEACHVFYDNYSVNEHNEKRLNSISSDLVNVKAEGIYPKGVRPVTDANGIVENTPFMKSLNLKKGARVMLTFNVNLSDSLVTGVLGTVLDFVYEESRLRAVIIAFDDPKVGQAQRSENMNDCSKFAELNGTPIYRTSLEHSMKKYGAVDEKFADNLITWADVIRKTFYDGGIDEVISTRRLDHIAKAFAIFKDKSKSIDLCVARFDEDTKVSFLDLYGKIDAGINPLEEVSKEAEVDENMKVIDDENDF